MLELLLRIHRDAVHHSDAISTGLIEGSVSFTRSLLEYTTYEKIGLLILGAKGHG